MVGKQAGQLLGKVACFKLGKKEKPRVIMPGAKLTIAMLKFNGIQNMP